jgi:hypothetical protein
MNHLSLFKRLLQLCGLCTLNTILASEIRYVRADPAEAPYVQANVCIPLTVHRLLREYGESVSYEQLYKELGTDDEGTDLQVTYDYLKARVNLETRYIVDGLDKKYLIATPPVKDITFGAFDKPTRLKFLWLGLYNNGCHVAYAYIDVKPLPSGEKELSYRISHSGRMDVWFLEEVLEPEEFWARTWTLWEVSKK